MTKATLCDICGDEVVRKYWSSSGKASTGGGTSVLSRSFRRRLIRLLLGPAIVWKRYRGRNSWERVDLCYGCTIRVRDEVQEQVQTEKSV